MWNISRVSYYADWVTIPILACGALISAHGGMTLATVLLFVLGFVLWTFIEYATHRWLFHRAYRREHFVHHTRPAAFFGVPAWQTALLFTAVLGGCMGSFGLDLGAALFAGLSVAYVRYLWAHDHFHHRPWTFASDSYWDRREHCHAIHHRKGIEANFGVSTSAWDMLLGTYRIP